MASSSASSIPNSFPKSSRFSTSLKVFKFASKEPRPPPPPPKDGYYARNKSVTSLSVPSTPLSLHPQHPYLSPEMSQSSMSIVSSATSATTSYSTMDPNSQKPPKKSRSGLFKFARRRSKARSTKSPPPSDDIPPPPKEDDKISPPWNFQHNIHVDEGFTGLPPSWTLSLAEAGFTEEEIAEIQTRRAGARAQYFFTDRPASPAYSPSEFPTLSNSNPRTTILVRQVSSASTSRSTDVSDHSSPSVSAPIGTAPLTRSPVRSIPHSHHSTEQTSTNNSVMPSFMRSGSVASRLSSEVVCIGPDPAPGTASTTYSPSRLAESNQPTTPPRRTYHITNSAVYSPPPSYSRSTPDNKENTYPSEKKGSDPSRPPSTPPSSQPNGSTPPSESPDTTPQRNSGRTSHESTDTPQPSSSNSHSLSTLPSLSNSRVQRLMALPPRLSLHNNTDSTDLSSWGEALLSGITTASEITPNSSTFAVAQDVKPLPTSGKPPRPSRPVPLVFISDEAVGNGHEDVPPSSWVEPASTARYDPLAESWSEAGQSSPTWNSFEGVLGVGSESSRGTALNGAYSPTPPLTPDVRGIPEQHDVVPEEKKDSDDGLLKTLEGVKGQGTNRDSSRSSTSTVLAEPATIFRSVSIARRTGAYVIDNSRVKSGIIDKARFAAPQSSLQMTSFATDAKQSPSPLSSHFGSEESSASTSGSSSFLSQDQLTPLTEVGLESPLTYYLDSSPSPDPSKLVFPPSPQDHLEVSKRDTFGGVKDCEVTVGSPEEEETVPLSSHPAPLPPPKPKIIISGVPSTGPPTSSTLIGPTPPTPFQPYPGWLSLVVAPLEQFIDEAIDPREYYLDLHEIAEGESGSVFAAQLTTSNRHKLRLPPFVEARDADDLVNNRITLVAIKSVAILPSGSPKLVDLERELSLMKGLRHDHVLAMDAVYVDLVEDTLWIRMELMERSLADIIGLVPEGLMLQDRMIARFASDVLLALEYLRDHGLAHRDVRSDNLLLNGEGILKLADFSNAVRVTPESLLCSDPAGVLYWQAPEVRSPPYDALQVDVWSLGATVWEMAEAEPPFAETQLIGDRWPSLSKPQLYSPAFHDFLRLCSQSPSSRPTPTELKKTPFINNACGRAVIIQLLSQCSAIEQLLQHQGASQE